MPSKGLREQAVLSTDHSAQDEARRVVRQLVAVPLRAGDRAARAARRCRGREASAEHSAEKGHLTIDRTITILTSLISGKVATNAIQTTLTCRLRDLAHTVPGASAIYKGYNTRSRVPRAKTAQACATGPSTREDNVRLDLTLLLHPYRGVPRLNERRASIRWTPPQPPSVAVSKAE